MLLYDDTVKLPMGRDWSVTQVAMTIMLQYQLSIDMDAGDVFKKETSQLLLQESLISIYKRYYRICC